ncbi:MAG: hypothetical protein V1813_04225 [Candidatus Aenigmatarchaeota archaeon]
MIIDDWEIYSGEISELKEYTGYRFPYDVLRSFDRESGDVQLEYSGLKKYENSTLKIYLNDELVREYGLYYIPATISKCPPYYGDFGDVLYVLLPYALAVVVIAAAVIFLVRRSLTRKSS